MKGKSVNRKPMQTHSLSISVYEWEGNKNIKTSFFQLHSTSAKLSDQRDPTADSSNKTFKSYKDELKNM